MNEISQELIPENSKKIWVAPTVEIIYTAEIHNYSISHHYEHIVFNGGTKVFYGS